MRTRSTLLLFAALLATACTNDDAVAPAPPTGPTSSLNSIDISMGVDNIVPIPASADDRIEAVFDRYTALTAPNGKRIHFLTQTGVTDSLLLRTRGLVRQVLRDVPGTTLGADKSAAYNAVANSEATFVLHTNAASFDPMDMDVAAFLALFGNRVEAFDASMIVQEASTTYMQASPAIDPSIAVTAKFVLTRGLSTSTPGFQMALQAAADNAVMMNLYRPDVMLPMDEIDDEYLAIALEAYYGIWAHDPNMDGTAGPAGEYDFDDRAALQAGDPGMFALLSDYFVPNHTYSAFLDSTFNGTFEMEFDAMTPYTNRSQYLERCGVRDPSTARINGNDLDNTFLGNNSGTEFEGRGGNDAIEAGNGADIVYMTGLFAEYSITTVSPTVMRIEDMVPNRDGIDDLRGVAQVVFTDMTVNL